jgi:hypothetical protein
MIEGLLDSVCRSRLIGVPPVRMPANMLWMVEHSTVRAAKQPPLTEPLAPKKRVASQPRVSGSLAALGTPGNVELTFTC